ncbi:epidermal growth factor-like protein 7 isoform X2 [Bos taurus]|nr:epidermal growth factor-like protein 7 isoform X2 [Bos taurus]
MREPPSPGECPGQQRAPIPAHTHTQATPRRRPFHPETQAMWGSQELLPLWFLVLAAGGIEHVYRPGRRVCVVGAPQGPASESFVQRVYQPFLTTCDGYRACSTYRTLYRTAYRRRPGPDPTRPRYACCPGWKWTGGVPGACGAAICQPPCQNGGSCVLPGRCHCPAGWQGNACQTDVDECSAGEGGCPQRCVNTAGSYWCQCWEGHRPSVDRAVCLPERGAPRVTPDPTTGADSEVKEEVQRLQSRVDVLEQKLQLVLAPLHSLASRALEHGLPDPGSLLAHSLQQLDRIDSLSEQISFLEEQLGSCSCKKEV